MKGWQSKLLKRENWDWSVTVQGTRNNSSVQPQLPLFQQCSIQAKLLNLTIMLLYKSGHAIEQLLLQWFNKAPHSISSITDSSILAYHCTTKFRELWFNVYVLLPTLVTFYRLLRLTPWCIASKEYLRYLLLEEHRKNCKPPILLAHFSTRF